MWNRRSGLDFSTKQNCFAIHSKFTCSAGGHNKIRTPRYYAWFKNGRLRHSPSALEVNSRWITICDRIRAPITALNNCIRERSEKVFLVGSHTYVSSAWLLDSSLINNSARSTSDMKEDSEQKKLRTTSRIITSQLRLTLINH